MKFSLATSDEKKELIHLSQLYLYTTEQACHATPSIFHKVQLMYWHFIDVCVTGTDKLPGFRYFASRWYLYVGVHLKWTFKGGFNKLWSQYCRLYAQAPRAGGAILSRCGRFVVMVESVKGVFGFPSGKVEHGSTSYNTAFRECYEEVGVDIRSAARSNNFIKLLHTNKRTVTKLYIVRTNLEAHAPLRTMDPLEISSIQWIPLSETLTRRSTSYTKQLFQQIQNIRHYRHTSRVRVFGVRCVVNKQLDKGKKKNERRHRGCSYWCMRLLSYIGVG